MLCAWTTKVPFGVKVALTTPLGYITFPVTPYYDVFLSDHYKNFDGPSSLIERNIILEGLNLLN